MSINPRKILGKNISSSKKLQKESKQMFTTLVPRLNNSWIDDVFADFDSLMNSTRFDFTQSFPAMNVYVNQDNNGVYLEMALVGYSKDYLNVEINGSELKISATVPEKDEEDSKHYFKQRIQAKDFERVYKIPEGYDTDNTEVKFADGLLTIFIPVKEVKTSVKKITIQ